jgi:hypothetical protein
VVTPAQGRGVVDCSGAQFNGEVAAYRSPAIISRTRAAVPGETTFRIR